LQLSTSILDRAELNEAAEFVHRTIPPTPQYCWPKLGRRIGCNVWVKHENHTPTGAFNVRGGLVYLDRLRQTNPEITAVISATRKERQHMAAKNVAVVLTGGNIERARFIQVLNGHTPSA